MIASWMTACFRSKTVTKEDGLEFVMDAQKGRIEGRVWSNTVTRENEMNFKMDRRKAIQLTGFGVVVLFARIYVLRQNVPKPVRMVGRMSVSVGGSVKFHVTVSEPTVTLTKGVPRAKVKHL